MVAGLVTLEDQYPHRVNFDNPDKTIVVEIIRVREGRGGGTLIVETGPLH